MVSIEQFTDSDDEGDQQQASKIQLGFSEPIEEQASVIGHRSPRWWKDWDGGIIGGRPSWLQPKDLPKKALQCLCCDEPMQFLCQLYVPLDHLPRAFHRSFYVFGCPQCCGKSEGQGMIRVLRVQLPQDNPFYPPENSEEPIVQAWKQHLPETWGVQLCRVCGQKATGKCPLQQVWFCGKNHQKEYKKYANNSKGEESGAEEAPLVEEEDSSPLASGDTQEKSTTNTPDNTPDNLPSVYAESELVVEEEPAAEEKDEEDDDDDNEIADRPTMFPSNNANHEEHDSDEDLEQEDLNEMVTGKASLDQTSTKDPNTNAFYKRIQERTNASEQCLRYSMQWRDRYDNTSTNSSTTNDDDDSPPLWIRSDHQPAEIPPCPYCHAPRAFEFQLMPQMLSFLHANQKTSSKAQSDQAQKNETAKQALIAANSIIANAEDPSQIPPAFADAKAKALETLQQDLMKEDNQRVEWGVVAIYTCTQSCTSSIEESSILGAYQEEYAWLQPALDTIG